MYIVADKSAISAQGCYVDNAVTRDLPTQVLIGVRKMTIKACIEACASAAYTYAATQVYCVDISLLDWIYGLYLAHAFSFVIINFSGIGNTL